MSAAVFTYTHELWEIDRTPHFLCVKKRFTSHLNGEIIQSPYNSSSSHTVKQCWGLPVNPTGHFSKFHDWWEVVVAHRATEYSVKQTAIPGQTLCQNRPSRALSLLLPNPHWEKQNNLTHPKWLFTWPRCWMSTLFFKLQSTAVCVGTFPLACWIRLHSLLVSFCISLTLSVQLLHTHWTVCHLVHSQKKELTKQNSGRSAAGLCDASVWGGWKHPCTHLTWFVEMKRPLCWDFPGSFPVR